jgi:hypothetical protein
VDKIYAIPVFLLFSLVTCAQHEPPTIKVEVASAVIWGEDSVNGAVSSTVLDPINGNAIHKLSTAGVDVSSQAGFERIGSGMSGSILNFTTTIVNNTGYDLVVRQAGANVDGHVLLPLAITSEKGHAKKHNGSEVWDLSKMYCFAGGFLSHQNFFSANESSSTFEVPPNGSLTASFLAKDPRPYSLRCSLEGCYPLGMLRFHITVNTTDYVFVWAGSSMAYCGK